MGCLMRADMTAAGLEHGLSWAGLCVELRHSCRTLLGASTRLRLRLRRQTWSAKCQSREPVTPLRSLAAVLGWAEGDSDHNFPVVSGNSLFLVFNAYSHTYQCISDEICNGNAVTLIAFIIIGENVAQACNRGLYMTEHS